MLGFITLLLLPAAWAKHVCKPVILSNNDKDCECESRRYIVTFHDDVKWSKRQEIVNSLPRKAHYVYNEVIKGFSATLENKDLAKLYDYDEYLEYVEADKPAVAHAVPAAEVPIAMRVELQAPWGLARIGHRQRGFANFRYHPRAGKGTCVYVLDTGIDDSHRDFGGRARQVRSFVEGQSKDGSGHGTHVAGTIGGRVYGVAKRAKIYGVKVLDDDGCGPASRVIAGIAYVDRDRKRRDCPNGVIVNLSLGFPLSKAMNKAARILARRGVLLVASAGNRNMPASRQSPAAEPWVCTASSSDWRDIRPQKRGYGSAVSVFAPGESIRSTLPGGKVGRLSGSSMAAAHVSGLGAYLAALEGLRGYALCSRIVALSTKDALKNVPPGTVNRLAFTGIRPRRTGGTLRSQGGRRCYILGPLWRRDENSLTIEKEACSKPPQNGVNDPPTRTPRTIAST